MIAQQQAAGGLSAADLIGVLAILVTIFGLLLSAIGVLILRLLTTMDARISEVKNDASNTIQNFRVDVASDFAAVWNEIRAVRNANEGRWTQPVSGEGPVRTGARAAAERLEG